MQSDMVRRSNVRQKSFISLVMVMLLTGCGSASELRKGNFCDIAFPITPERIATIDYLDNPKKGNEQEFVKDLDAHNLLVKDCQKRIDARNGLLSHKICYTGRC